MRVAGNQADLAVRRRTAWGAWFGPLRSTQLASAAWLAVAWAVFALAFVAAVVWVVDGLDRGPGAVVLVLTAGGRLSAYVGSAVGELGFLRGIWLDSAQRLAWLEDFAAQQNAHADQHAPERVVEGIRFEGVSFAYPGTARTVLDDVDLTLPAGAVVAVVGENGAGKSTLVKLLARMYAPSSGQITVDGVDIAHIDVGEWRGRLAGAFQDFARLELVAQTTVGARRRAAAGRPGRGRVGGRPGGRRPRSSTTCETGSTPSSARPGTAAWTSASASGRSSHWPVATCGPSRCCWCSTSRRPPSTPRPSTRSSSGSRRARARPTTTAG